MYFCLFPTWHSKVFRNDVIFIYDKYFFNLWFDLYLKYFFLTSELIILISSLWV
uniref:Uncharacterized protein n=1 Tax=Anguilla anguilla TaxID=7936 RepID=A0A0E9WTC7_ANGAN